MTTYEYQKLVYCPDRLRSTLAASGFPSAGVISSCGETPKVWVTVSEQGDPSSAVNAYVDPNKLTMASDKPVGTDGIPEAFGDGQDTHSITIYKKDWGGVTVPGSEVVRIQPSQMIAANPHITSLVDGIGRISVGPTTMIGTITLKVVDQAGNLVSGSLMVRFV
jgi:hypothetical protein